MDYRIIGDKWEAACSAWQKNPTAENEEAVKEVARIAQEHSVAVFCDKRIYKPDSVVGVCALKCAIHQLRGYEATNEIHLLEADSFKLYRQYKDLDVTI